METINILKELVSFNTSNPIGNEAIAADWIGDYLKKYGFEIIEPSCGENRKSVVAKYKFNDDGPKLVLNGHIDVVPAGDDWDTNPFNAIEKDGKIYGRGTSDMKGGVAAMIGAATEALKNSDNLKGELILVFVADEEINNLGTISCRDQWIDADYVIIGEPTELDIEIAHLGTARFNIDIYGRSCHSGMPWNGINAVTKAVKVINKINELNDSLGSVIHETVGRPYISVTMLQAGEKDNIIPGKCRISVDYRMVPGETGDTAQHKLEKILSELANDDKEFKYKLNRYINLEPGEINRNHSFVKFVESICEKEFGYKKEVKAFPATCEQAIFSREGIPTLILGPGSIEQAHIKNEYVEIDQIILAEKIYTSIINNLLLKE